ncbi:MAG: CPBP family glutamic-type intramembrane protease [Lachnospiraceae bacterium]|nr:CPBP family glutamic-type intramembrane protease [Lachnospiraceae bacterium]
MKADRSVWFILPMRSVLFVVIFLLCAIMTGKDLTDITHWWSIKASAANLFTFPYLAPMMIAPIPPYLALLNLLLFPITTTIAEEGVYLGCGVNSFHSKWAAVLVPAFFYAFQHSFIPTIFDGSFVLYRFLSFLPLTIWICYQYHRKGGIAYIMAGHWLLNIATTIQIVITSFYPQVYVLLSSQ